MSKADMMNSHIQQKVMDAIRDGDCDLLKDLIVSKIIHINSELDNGQTPLAMAISQKKFPAMVKLLLEMGADVSLPSLAKPRNPYLPHVGLAKKIHPLEMVLETKNLEIIMMVFNKGPKLTYYSGCMVKMVCQAVKLEAYDLVQRVVRLVEDQEMFSVSSVNLAEPLALAIKLRYTRMVQLLVTLGANVNREYDGCLPLVWAANNNDLRMCLCLLNHGATLDGNAGQLGAAQTPLSHAINGGLEIAVCMLIKLGCNPNGIVSWSSARGLLSAGSSMLHFAVIKRNKMIMKTLITAQAQICQKDDDGNTSLHLACRCTNGQTDIVKYLLDTHKQNQKCEIIKLSRDIDVQNKKGQTPLMVAIQQRDHGVVKLFIDAGSDINICDIEKRMALHFAIESDSEEITMALLQAGCQVDGTHSGIKGCRYTPLQLAVKGNNTTLVDILLDHGANLNVLTSAKETMLHLAVLAHSDHLVKLLLEKEQNVNAVTKSRETPLMLAARQDNIDVCHLLIDGGAVLNAKDKNQETALSLSVYFGFEDNARLLIANGANINLADERNTTPLYWAIFNCRMKTLKLLLLAGAKFTKHDMYRYPKNLSVMKNTAMFNWMLMKLSNPQSLQDVCRRSIRNTMVDSSKEQGILIRVHQLHLPTKLKNYLLYDTDECIDIVKD